MAIASPIVVAPSTAIAIIHPYILYEVLSRQSRNVVAVRGLHDALDVHYSLMYQKIDKLDTKNCNRRQLKELMPKRAQHIIPMMLKNALIVFLVIRLVNTTSINLYNTKLCFIYVFIRTSLMSQTSHALELCSNAPVNVPSFVSICPNFRI